MIMKILGFLLRGVYAVLFFTWLVIDSTFMQPLIWVIKPLVRRIKRWFNYIKWYVGD